MSLPKNQDPRVKLLLSYDILSDSQQAYYEFILRDFIPKLQAMGLVMTEIWHTAYGDYPLRMAAFVAPDKETVDNIMNSDEWKKLQEQFDRFVTNLQLKIIPYKEGFQF
jgi:hypothetical protein